MIKRSKTFFDSKLKDRSQVYIIPNRNGFKYLMINFFLFIMALSFSNNMALIINFLMLAYFIIEMLDTHRIINNLKLNSLQIKDAHSNGPQFINGKFTNECENLHLVNFELFDQNNSFPGRFHSSHESKYQGLLSPLNRGHYPFYRIKFYTTGKSNLFYVWRFFKTAQNTFIYPKSTKYPHNKLSNNQYQSQSGELIFKEHKKYLPGDDAFRIDWKLYAKNYELYVKNFLFIEQNTVSLNFNKLNGNDELRLEYLSFLISQCLRSGLTWELILPNKKIDKGEGRSHYKQSMEALSAY